MYMGCETVKIGGVTMIACTRGRRPSARTKCVVCHKRFATQLCDHELAEDDFKLEGQTTCDVGLCKSCSTTGPDDTDFCPKHKEAGAQLQLF
jgi:hypothetical protein